MAKCMRDYNPPCKEELEGVILTNSTYDDLEGLTTQSSTDNESITVGFRTAVEIELQNIAMAIKRVAIAHRKSQDELTWFQYIFGNSW